VCLLGTGQDSSPLLQSEAESQTVIPKYGKCCQFTRGHIPDEIILHSVIFALVGTAASNFADKNQQKGATYKSYFG
jgi:hypothetical protein